MKSLILLVALAAAPALAAPTFPAHNGTPVVDSANLIPADKEAALVERLKEIEKSSKHQVMVFTTNTIEGAGDIDEYGTLAARHFGAGDVAADDGVLVTIAVTPEMRKARIDTGSGMEVILTDAEGQNVIQAARPQFKANDWAGGITTMVDEIAKEIVPPSPEQIEIAQRAENERRRIEAANAEKAGNVFMIVLGILVAPFIGWGGWWLATGPARRRKAAEEAALLAEINRKRRERLEAEAREQQERIARARQEREDMLNAMSPSARQKFLDNERREEERREAERRAAARREQERRAAEEARRAAERKRRAAEEARRPKPTPTPSPSRSSNDDSWSRSTWSSPSPSPSPSSSDSWSSGGGGYSGGGSSGDI